MKSKYIISIIFFLFNALGSRAQKFENLALTPPMGWNSWNGFQCDGINEQVVKETADAMLATGMKEAGYQYIVIDDCWQTGRDSVGNIIADAKKFPSGIKALANYIHSKGLKFGIYTCAGTATCAGRPGSRGYEFQDARQYAAWGIDYLKEDWCNTSTQNAQESYTLMRDALYKAGRPIVFSLCEWGLSKPWLWASDVAQLWRTTGDIQNNWDVPDAKDGKVWAGGVIINLDMQKNLEKYAGPDHWNDPDMLEIGNGKLTPQEERAQMSLWCMLAAPLIMGNDLRNMSKETAALICNKELIAIDQDSLGKQGYKILDQEYFEIFMKPLQNNDTAICLFNRGDQSRSINIKWSDYKISNNFVIKDILNHTNQGTTSTVFRASIAKHDVIMLRLTKIK